MADADLSPEQQLAILHELRRVASWIKVDASGNTVLAIDGACLGSLAPCEPGEQWVEVPAPARGHEVSHDGEDEGGNPVWAVSPIPTVMLSIAKAAKTDAVVGLLNRKHAAGYRVPTGTLAGKVLQIRDERDITNWLTAKDIYRDAIAAGQGAVVAAEFRTASNETFALSFDEAVTVLNGLRAHGLALLQNSWALKDLIAEAADQAALDAIDITTGWPS